MADLGDDLDVLAGDVLRRSEALLADATKTGEQHGRWTSRTEWPVSVQPASSNRKLAPQRRVQVGNRVRNEPFAPYCSSTYVSISATCPDSCTFKGAGCYAIAGMAVQRLDRGAKRTGMNGTQVADVEAEAIDQMFVRGVPQDGARGGRDLRLHVSGDAASATAARLLVGAARRWRERGGGLVFTFTHQWRTIPRSAWGPISVLASCETPEQVEEARAQGYSPAITVEQHESDRPIEVAGTRIIPCPNQTRGRTCVECRLCLDADKLFERRAGIAFQIHGNGRDAAIVALDALGPRQQRTKDRTT